MMRPEFRALYDALGHFAVGQDRALNGLLLGVVAREHVWLEGPTGCGKTQLAEALGPACGARSRSLCFHRDTRLSQEWSLQKSGDRIWSWPPSSGVSSSGAEILVLDDPARAPGEVTAPLFAALARRSDPRLETAVATGLPPGRSRSEEPLSAAALDVFGVQVRMRGLLLSGDLVAARAVLDQPVLDQPVLDQPAGSASRIVDATTRRAAQRSAAELEFGSAARRALVRAVSRLRELTAADPDALLSDRSFGRVAPRLMRAHAWLRGAVRVEPGDVAALEFMLARRVPEQTRAAASEVLQEASSAGVAGAGSRAGEAGTGSDGGTRESVAEPIESALGATNDASDATDTEIDVLVRALEGRLGRGRASPREDPAGVPRSWRQLRGLDELLDADPGEAWLWASGRVPELPRTPRRERRDRGGSIALLRDVSASMEGRLGAWAGEVVAALAGLGRRKRLQLGYVEFNHQAERFSHAGRFFHRGYAAISALGARARCGGRTSYQAPLGVALRELARAPEGERHVVLLTDGIPVTGDPQVREERAEARRLGVRIHTVFVGTGPRPDVLDDLARETGGLAFHARPRAGRGIAVEVACTSA